MSGDWSIRALSAEEESARKAALDLASRLIGKSLPLGVAEVQALYQVLLEDHSDFKEGLIALGIAFGELICAKAGYEWVRVDDEWGSENSLSPQGWDATCHPISMMQKRVERGEDVIISELRDDTIYTVQRRIDAGKVGPRGKSGSE